MNWEEVISFENLYKAHRRARLCKRHKKEVINFEANLSQNLWDLHYALKYGTYKISGYNKFFVFDPKEREVQAITYKDRVVQHSLCDNYLIPLIDKHLIFDNVACRKGKGTGAAIARFRFFMTKFYKKYKDNGYFVKIDVKKYFANISHNLLKQKLQKIVQDEQCLNLIYGIIDSYNGQQQIGLPIGNQSSQYLALLYLNDVDRLFKEQLKVKFYLRYMDDIIMIVYSKQFAQNCLNSANNALQKELLKINPKSHICPIKNGVEFLGWNFRYSQTGAVIQKVKKSSKSRILKKIKCIKYYKSIYKKPKIDTISPKQLDKIRQSSTNATLNPQQLDKIRQIFASYQGHLSKGNAFAFINLIAKNLNAKLNFAFIVIKGYCSYS